MPVPVAPVKINFIVEGADGAALVTSKEYAEEDRLGRS